MAVVNFWVIPHIRNAKNLYAASSMPHFLYAHS